MCFLQGKINKCMLIFSLDLQQDLVDTSKESNLITKRRVTCNVLPPDTAASDSVSLTR